jgi:FKBP-type peptidyl-prolyl cis-trans isomerase FkpA
MIFAIFLYNLKFKTSKMIRKNFKMHILFSAAILLLLVVSCDPSKQYQKDENNSIQNYLNANSSLKFVLRPSGLYYLEVVAGTGDSPVLSDSAFVKYTGKLLSGTIFDSNVSTGTLYGFIVGQNIVGFDEGVMLMKAGGKSTLLIPSKLGYGSMGSYPVISGYTPLLFDIELVKVVHHSAK